MPRMQHHVRLIPAGQHANAPERWPSWLQGDYALVGTVAKYDRLCIDANHL